MLLWLANYLSVFEPSFAVFQYLTLAQSWVFNSLDHGTVYWSMDDSFIRDAPDRSVGPTRWARITSLEAGNAHNGRCVDSHLHHCLYPPMG